MYKICRTEQSSQRQRYMERGLLELMSKRRYEDISISDLCCHLQIPRRIFYRYFSSKDGALFALLDHLMMDFQLSEPPSGPTPPAIPQDMARYFQFWRKNKPLLDALSRSGLTGLLVERATCFALQEKMMPRYMLRWDPELQQLAMSFTVSGLMSMVLRWNQQGFVQSPEEMCRIATGLLTNPLINRSNQTTWG